MSDLQEQETSELPPTFSVDASFVDKYRNVAQFNDPAETKIRETEERLDATEQEEAQAEANFPIVEHMVGDTQFMLEERDDGFHAIAKAGPSGPIQDFKDSPIFVGEELPPEPRQEPEEGSFLEALMTTEFPNPLEVGEGLTRGIGAGVAKFLSNVIQTGGDIVLTGETQKEFDDFMDVFFKELDKRGREPQIPEEFLSDTPANAIAAGGGEIIGNFVLPALSGFGLLRAAGAGPIVASVGADAFVGFAGLNPNEPNLANMIPEDSEAFGLIRDLVGTDPEDPDFINRAKNMTEALVTLGIGEATGRLIIRGIKEGANLDKLIPEPVRKQIDAFIRDEEAALKLPDLSGVQRIGQPPQTGLDKAVDVLKNPEARNAPVVTDEQFEQMRESIKSTGSFAQSENAINLTNITTPEEMDNLLNTLADMHAKQGKKVKRGKITFDRQQEMADMSRLTGFSVEDVLSRQAGDLWPTEKLKAARDLLQQQIDVTRNMHLEIKGGKNTDADLVAFRRQLAIVSGMQMQVKGAGTEVARALGFMRANAVDEIGINVQMRELLDQAGGRQENEKLIGMFDSLGDDPQSIAKFARNAEQATGADVLYSVWINSLLGSPDTHMVNMMGNSLAAMQGTTERYTAALYGNLERGAQKLLGKTPAESQYTIRSANAYARGQALGVIDGLRAGGKAFATGKIADKTGKIPEIINTPLSTAKLNELPSSQALASKIFKRDELIQSNTQLAATVDFLGEFYYGLPGRALVASDEFFKAVAYRASLHESASLEVLQQGLTEAEQSARMISIIQDPNLNAPDMHRRALDNQREFTFQAPPGPFAENILKARNNANIGDIPVGRVVMPFFNVINNITKFTVGRTPQALFVPGTKVHSDFWSKDPMRRQLAVGKVATASSLLGAGAWMSMNGMITGRMTDNQKLRRNVQDTGRQPYSMILPDGTTAAYNRLEPVGMFLAIGATTGEALSYVEDEEQRESLVFQAAAAVIPYLEDKSFTQGISNFMNAFSPQYGNDDARQTALAKYIANIAASGPGAIGGPLAPNTPLMKKITRETGDRRIKNVSADPYVIEKDEFGDDQLVPSDPNFKLWQRTINKIWAGTPGLSRDMPGYANFWGDEIAMEGGLGPDTVSPIYVKTLDYKPDQLRGKGFPRQMENGFFHGVQVGRDITAKQHQKFIGIAGISGEMQRIGFLPPVSSELSAIEGKDIVGMPVKLDATQRLDFQKLMNEIQLPNEMHPDKQDMNMKELLTWVVQQPEYTALPDDINAVGSKGDILRQAIRPYKMISQNLFFQENPLLRQRSIQLKRAAQNTGVQ